MPGSASFYATGVFMAAVLVALVVSYALIRRLPVMTIVSAVIVIVFGGLTIVLADRDLHQVEADDHLPAVRRRACSAG